jgi:hypothetical protein
MPSVWTCFSRPPAAPSDVSGTGEAFDAQPTQISTGRDINTRETGEAIPVLFLAKSGLKSRLRQVS